MKKGSRRRLNPKIKDAVKALFGVLYYAVFAYAIACCIFGEPLL